MATFNICFLFITLPILTLSRSIIKSVTLTPVNNHINGVEVNTNIGDVIVTSNEWNINVSSNNGWHVHISMNESWKFLSNQQSTISLKTYLNSTANTQNKDIIFIFSQNTNKYITSTIRINGNSSKNGIYPHCTPTNNDESVSMSNGSINLFLDDNNESTNREYKLTQGSNYNTIPTNTNTLNTSPFTIELINNPITELSKYKYTNQQCQFESFSTEHPIDIYISAVDIAQVLAINKFEIILSYDEIDQLSELSESEVPLDDNQNDKDNTEKNKSSSGTFIESDTELIVIMLIAVIVVLCMLCIILIAIIRKLEKQFSKNNINIELEPNMEYIEGAKAKELVLHTITFKNEEISKNHSFESRTSIDSELTDYNHEFDTNIETANDSAIARALADDITVAQAVVKVNVSNNSESDNDVILDMVNVVTAGQ